MALPKQTYQLTFRKGVDTKTDPLQIAPDNFLLLENTLFSSLGALTKRNGFAQLASLPSNKYSYLTTYNESLIALGSGLPLAQYTAGTATWTSKGTFEPCQVSVYPLYSAGTNQTYSDSAQSTTTGLRCVVVGSNNNGTVTYRYLVVDATNGNVQSQALITSSYGAITSPPKVWTVGRNFYLVFCATSSGSIHLQYIAISCLNGSVVSTATDISTTITSNVFAGCVTNSALYLSWPYTSGVQIKYINQGQAQSAVEDITTSVVPSVMSVSADTASATPVIWVACYDTTSTHSGLVFAETPILTPVLGVTQWTAASLAVANLTCAAYNGTCTIFYEVTQSNYNNYVASVTVTQGGEVNSAINLALGIGLASQAVVTNGNIYVLTCYASLYQPTYFLWSFSVLGGPVAKIAYSNGGGYYTNSGYLPSISVSGTTLTTTYLYKYLLQEVSKGTYSGSGQNVIWSPPASGVSSIGVYAELGVYLVNFDLTSTGLTVAEMGSSLQINSGFLWQYDGSNLVEQNFWYWPDSVTAAWSTSGGHMLAQPDAITNNNAYYYQVIYKWVDNQGLPHQSAPSLPVAVTTTGTGNTGSVTLTISTLRLTYKTATPVQAVIYRWSVAQQAFYQVTSVSAPLLNNPNANTISFTDTLADSSINGSLIYTSGGVVEDVNGPACTGMTMFDDRLWLIDAEDPNLLWYSKQVIESTPVEMSDLFTQYIAPSIGSQGLTGAGGTVALAALDANLIQFRKQQITFINGTGPDNTGANSGYSQVQPVQATVGTINLNSIVFIPDGLIFQSANGLWLLTRGLQTEYVGWPVEGYNSANVLAASAIPGTNQVRFVMDSGLMLVYDYFVKEWNTFTGVSAVSATIFQGYHTFINQYGQCFQETPDIYADGTIPVCQKFTTGWFNLAGSLQGYEKAYYFTFKGTYYSPHKLLISIATNNNVSPVQQVVYDPNNPYSTWGSDTIWGSSSEWGTTSSLESFKFFFENKKVENFQITVQELYDASQSSVPPGAGLAISGLTLVYGVKKGYRPFPATSQLG